MENVIYDTFDSISCLNFIFQVLGTPTEENWPGISTSEELQNYNFPPYPAEPLVKRAPRLDAEGIDLVSKFLLYEARKRVSAKEGMHHSYFASLGPGVNNLLDGKDFFFVIYKSVGNLEFLNGATFLFHFYQIRAVGSFDNKN